MVCMGELVKQDRMIHLGILDLPAGKINFAGFAKKIKNQIKTAICMTEKINFIKFARFELNLG